MQRRERGRLNQLHTSNGNNQTIKTNILKEEIEMATIEHNYE